MKKLFSIMMSVFLIVGCMMFPQSPVVKQAHGETKWGIDVSEHQGRIDWAKVKASGCSFAIIRCGFGQDQAGQDDDYWEYNSSECERLGIPYGTYIYSYAKSVSAAQGEANHVLRLIKGKNLSYPVYYDLEESSQASLGATALGNIATAFCNKIEAAGYSVGVYANTSWWNNYLTASCFNNWYRWVAQYASSCQYKGRYEIWQYTDRRSVSGISGGVDANYQYSEVGNSGGTVSETLETNKSTYSEGEDIYVTASTATSDAWVAIYGADDTISSSTSSYYWYWVNGTDTQYGHGGTWIRGQSYNIYDTICSHRTHPNGSMIATGNTLPAGKYKIAILYGDYKVIQQKTITITDDKAPYLEVAKTSFAQGEDIKVKAYSTNEGAWVGIFPGSSPTYGTGSYVYYYYTSNYNDTYVNLQDVGTRNDSHSYKDLPPGTYTLTLFGDDGYSQVDATKQITITGDTLVADKSTYDVGDPIYVTANCSNDGSWVGLYKKGENPGNVTSMYWYYVVESSSGINRSGQTIELTDDYYLNGERNESVTAGEYTIKIFGDSGYTNVLKSIDITIQKTVTKVVTTAATCTATGKTVTYYSDGTTSTVTLPKIDHMYTQKVVTAPTCTQKGYTTYTCSSCKTATKISDYTNATGHYRPKGVADCVATKCSACGTAMAATASHTAGTAATCIAPQTCTACGTQLAGKTSHVPGAAATCTTPQKCSTPGCGEVLTPAKGHKPGPAATCTTPQICITCEKVLVETGGHTPGAEATCTEPQVCTNPECGMVLEPARGHKPERGQLCTDPHVCSVCGEEQSEGKPHTPGPAATCTDPQNCTACGFEMTPKKGHHMSEATCTKLSACQNANCDYTEGELADHTPVVDEAVAPGCLTMGLTKGSHCDICGEQLTLQQVVPATGHDMSAATCKEASKCQNSGCNYTEGVKLGHDWEEGDITKAPTCTTDGERVDTCKNDCGETKTVILAAVGHKYIGTVTAPTCTKEGYTTYVCHNGCGDSYKAEYVEAKHNPGPAATCTSTQNCKDCGAILEEIKKHTPGAAPTCTEFQTCKDCHTILAGAKGHKPGAPATCTTPQTCTVEGCDFVFEDALPHTPGPAATCTTPQTCMAEDCDYVFENAKGHKPGAEATCTTPQICTECHTVLKNIAGHTLGKAFDCETPQTCVDCHAVIMAATGHTIETVEGYAATCSAEGLSDKKSCLTCGKVFAEAVAIPKKSHKYVETITPATMEKDGVSVTKCTDCNLVTDSTVIPRVKLVRLSATNLFYNGKVRTPFITVKDTQGEVLKKGRDYTVKTPQGRKNAGIYVYTINLTGKYKGTKELSLTIKPGRPTIKNVTAAKKTITVKWKKAIKQGSGYQIMVSRSKSFSKNNKTVLVSGNKKTSGKVTKLTAKKTYYVKVRTYKTVKVNGNSSKVYSKWSEVKKVKTK